MFISRQVYHGAEYALLARDRASAYFNSNTESAETMPPRENTMPRYQ